MAKTSEIIKILENYAPLDTAEEWDNSGWQVFLGNDYTTKVLICLTVTEDIINQAEDLGCNLIVSHHPVIFKPLKVVKDSKIVKAIQRGIQIYSLHTNCDKAKNGTSDLIAEKFSITPEDVVVAIDSSKMPLSIFDKFEDDEDGQELIEKIPYTDNEEVTLNRIHLLNVLNTLTEREQKIIILRYFRDRTQSEVAESLGVSQVQVSRLENKIIEKIRLRF